MDAMAAIGRTPGKAPFLFSSPSFCWELKVMTEVRWLYLVILRMEAPVIRVAELKDKGTKSLITRWDDSKVGLSTSVYQVRFHQRCRITKGCV